MKYKNYLEKIKGYSPKTTEIYERYAAKLEECAYSYKTMLSNLPDCSINTRRLIISAIISYYKFKKDERWKELQLPKKQITVKDYISYSEYKVILDRINFKTKMGYQKRIIVRLMFETGIRSQELLNIKKQHIMGNTIKILGKGRKERIVKISTWLEDELSHYLKSISDKLFSFGYKNLYKKISKLSHDKKITPHMFRRGYAKYCFDNKISIYDISLSMGHSNIETTAQYIKRNSDDVDIYKIF